MLIMAPAWIDRIERRPSDAPRQPSRLVREGRPPVTPALDDLENVDRRE
jgi:hypothetical protein